MPVKAVLMPTGEEPQEEAKESPEEKVEEVVKKPRGKAKAKPKAKAEPKAKAKAKAKPKAKPEPEEPGEPEEPEEPAEPEEPEEPEPPFEEVVPKKKARAKRAARSDVDLQAKTMCPICHKVLSNHALLYTHRCAKCDTDEKKYPKRLEDEEPPAPEPLVRQTHVVREAAREAPPYVYQQPQLSYKDILMMRQHEMRQARHARQVAPLRSHYGM